MPNAGELALASSTVSLAANTLGLAKTVADSFATGSSLVDVSVGVLKWLSRECIDDKEFEYALKLCESNVTHVFPNDGGLAI